MKRRQKAEQKAKEKSEKVSAAPPPAAGGEKVESKMNKEEEMDPSEYRKMRIAALEEARQQQTNPFPHKFHVNISLVEFNTKYDHLKADEILTDVTVSVAGRVMAKREASTKLYFYDLHGAGARLQLMANARCARLLVLHSLFTVQISLTRQCRRRTLCRARAGATR
jgi:lysyl-tRNA synthetase class 2